MKRLAERFLKKWYANPKRKPLVVRGARQVGKSTLVRRFCRENGIDLIEINLEIQKIHEFAKQETFNIDQAIQEIELLTNKKIVAETMLFIDEIQEQPMAISRLRYFYEQRPELAVITAGSLLETVIDPKTFRVPVGRIEYFHLGPMTFQEFLWAKGENILEETLSRGKVTGAVFTRARQLLLEYYFVGGMPEAVLRFVESKSLLEARNVHRLLVQTYRDDIGKYAGHPERVLEVFNYVPKGSGRKVKYSNISEDKSRDVKMAIQALVQARVILQVRHSNCSGLPLKSSENERVFKLYFLDIGLSNYMQGMSWSDLQELGNNELINSGSMAEQFVAQHLIYRDQGLEEPNLSYWLRERHTQKAEVDFVISENSEIIPVEVKAGKRGKLRSLVSFAKEKNVNLSIRFDLKFRENLRDDNLLNLPIFLVGYYKHYL